MWSVSNGVPDLGALDTLSGWKVVRIGTLLYRKRYMNMIIYKEKLVK